MSEFGLRHVRLLLLLLLLLFGVRSSKTHHSQIRTSCIFNAKFPSWHLHTPHLTAPMSKTLKRWVHTFRIIFQ